MNIWHNIILSYTMVRNGFQPFVTKIPIVGVSKTVQESMFVRRRLPDDSCSGS